MIRCLSCARFLCCHQPQQPYSTVSTQQSQTPTARQTRTIAFLRISIGLTVRRGRGAGVLLGSRLRLRHLSQPCGHHSHASHHPCHGVHGRGARYIVHLRRRRRWLVVLRRGRGTVVCGGGSVLRRGGSCGLVGVVRRRRRFLRFGIFVSVLPVHHHFVFSARLVVRKTFEGFLELAPGGRMFGRRGKGQRGEHKEQKCGDMYDFFKMWSACP